MSFVIGEEPYDSPWAAYFADKLPPKNVTIELNELGALHVIGSPGEGKSTFLGRIADACLDAGEGVLLIDPKGDLAEDVVQRTAHYDKLIYIAPGAYPDQSFALNVLEADAARQDIVAGNLLSMFKHMGRYNDQVMTLVGKYLSAGVQTAYTKRQPTLVDVIAILLDKHFRDEFLEKTRRPDLKLFWDLYDKRSPVEQRSQVDSTLGRLWDFLLYQHSYFFIASPVSTLRLADWLNAGQLVVMNLAQGLDEPDTLRMGNLVVAYLTTQYKLRASKLVDWDPSVRWRLIVDEFHDFAPAPYAQIIRQGRFFNFYPIVAHQDMAQLDEHPQLKGALGHIAQLSFRRSDADVPATSYEAQRQYVESQEAMRQHEADWRYRSPTGTSTTRLLPPNWNTAAKPTRLETALEQAKQYMLPKSAMPSLWERYDAWKQRVTMKDDEPTNQSTNRGRGRGRGKATKNAADPLSGSGATPDVPDGADSARMGGAGGARPTRLLDFLDGGADVLLGGAEPPRPGPKSADGPERHQ